MSGRATDGVLPSGSRSEALRARTRAALDAMLVPGATAVIGVSGGADSTGLAVLASELRPDLVLRLAHVRHGLRPDHDDVAWVRELAGRLELPLHERAVTVERAGDGPEAAARAARYDALADVARETGAEAVLVAHTADDQAETVLLNVVRGSGLGGLAAMAPVREDRRGPRILRPLLDLRRDDLRRLLTAEGWRWVEDPTNHDADQRRARARHEALPALARLHPAEGDAVAALVRLSRHARRDDHALEVLAEREYRRLGRRWGPVLAVPRPHLDAMPEGLALRVVRVVLAELGCARPGVGALRRALTLPTGRMLRIGHVALSAGGGWIAAAPDDAAALEPRLVALPGRTVLRELDLDLCTDLEREPVDEHVLASPPPGARQQLQARLPVPSHADLSVRARRPGDRIALRHGSRSVQDLLVDAGVPRLMRDLVPIVVDRRDRPLWVPGVALARDASSLSHVRAWLAPHGAR